MFPRIMPMAPMAPQSRIGAGASVGDQSLFQILFSGGKTAAGTVVTQHSAINLPVVYAAIGIIADSLAMLPIEVLQKKDGKVQQVSSHPASYLLNMRPNDFMSAFTLRQTAAYHTLGWGNGYQEIEIDKDGVIKALWPLLPDSTRARKSPNKDALIYSTTVSGKTFDIDDDRICHVPALGFDGYTGYSPISLARQAIGMGLAMEEFGAKFFANDAKSGGFLQHPGKLSPLAKDNIRESTQEQGGLDNAHRIKVLEEGMKFVQTTIAPDDAQFLGSREFQISEIARIFRVPLPLLQAMEKSTSWGTGVETMMLGFITWTLQPWGTKIEQEYNHKIFTTKEKADGLFMRLNYRALLRGDMAARKEYYKAGINDGWMTRNEVREKEDMQPLPGLDEPLQPLNMTKAGEDTNAPVQPDN